MKPLAPFKTLNFKSLCERCAELSTRIIAQLVILGTLLLAFSTYPIHAQVGNGNPTGPSGIFNGNLENTGVDPWTGNATRSITDIAVAGAVGEYPLVLVRTANSRAPSTTEVFGWAGGWNHNYNWILEDSPSSTNQNFQPTSYALDFPDGRVETLQSVTWDTTCYRVRTINGGPGSSAGVRERFAPVDFNPNHANTYMRGYLILPDGGKVEFQASLHTTPGGRYYYKYSATAIIDPYGLRTTLQWEVVGPTHLRRLAWVIEPAGRWLRFLYTGANNPKIDHVDASDGRTVQYYYISCNGCRLNLVRYYNNPAWDAHYQYTGSNIGGQLPPLLWTADDPMYSGPMKRRAYEYKTGTNSDGTAAVYGQVYRIRYWDGTSGHEGSGSIVSTLAVGWPNNNPVYRTETRGDGAMRTFIYNGAGSGYLAWASDFMGVYAAQNYDQTTKYIISVMDRRGNTTGYTSDRITGNVTQVKFPLTQGDTPGQSQQPTVNYTYTNGYHLHTIQGENGFTTTINRYGDNRIQNIAYPDGGSESFTYDSAHLNQVSTHGMTTGGTESWAYDGLHRLQFYSDAYHSNSNPANPSIRYYYDALGRVNGIYDALSNPTNWQYNDRGQLLVTTLAPDPFDSNNRHTVTNVYNPNGDGTLVSVTDQLGHQTSYTYDDYRRLKSVTTPGRGDGSGTHTTTYNYWSGNWVGDDYRFTDSKICWIVLPSGKKIWIVYDDNRRTQSITVAPNTAEAASTGYTCDAVGNVTWVTDPMGHWINTVYDQRNRQSSINHMGQTTILTYDTAGHARTITRPNGQVITYEDYDEMNRLKRQRATQTPEPDAVAKYTYYRSGEGPVGLLHTMQDPRLVATNSSEKYEYLYDLMGRKAWMKYPIDSLGVRTVEGFTYDNVGRVETFRNRKGNYQTFRYDALNRLTQFTWDDGTTPWVGFAYDAASRVTDINNPNAYIHRTYWGDNLLQCENERIAGAPGSKTVTYFYDDDGNRSQIYYPDGGYNFPYTYTWRNQLKTVNGWATYDYDLNGHLYTRTLNNGTSTDYRYDGFDRLTWVTHNGTDRWFNYGYYENSNNRKYTRRWNGQAVLGEVFGYDLADQVSGMRLNIPDPGPTPAAPSRSIFYDANGNRTSFGSDTYMINNNSLNQYSRRNNVNASYDYDGNLTDAFDGSTYAYDAQNRLTSAPGMTFTYDGLNRQISRTVTGQPTTFSVWDGWNLIEEYQAANNGALTALYLYGAGDLIASAHVATGQFNYYYQDGSGSTSHVIDENGTLKEWYRYDLQGTPFIYDANGTQLSTSARNVRHLFNGQQWYSGIGLYDLRNRFYSPDTGRFLQPDPIGFRSDRTNLYRYCRNNPVTKWDPSGLLPPTEVERVTVTAPEIHRGGPPGGVLGGGYPTAGGGEPGRSDNPSDQALLERVNKTLERLSNESSTLSAPPPQNPPLPNPATPSNDPLIATTTAEFIALGNMIEHGNTMDTTPAIDIVDLFSGGIAGLVRSSVRRFAAETTATEGARLFRVFGGEAKGLGQYYTTTNPGSVANYREAAGLFPGNTGQFVLEGTLNNNEGIIFRAAAPGPGGVGGGLPEIFVPNPTLQLNITRVSGVNPPF